MRFLSAEVMGASSSSGSTDKSHKVSWSSEPEAAKTEESVGCHSTDVIGAVCHWNCATGDGVLNVIRLSWCGPKKKEEDDSLFEHSQIPDF